MSLKVLVVSYLEVVGDFRFEADGLLEAVGALEAGVVILVSVSVCDARCVLLASLGLLLPLLPLSCTGATDCAWV